MNTTELIADVRQDVFVGDTVFPDYDNARILIELNRTLRTTFEREIVLSRSGYWQQTKLFTVIPGRGHYRIPDRAITGGLEQVALADSATSKFVKIQEVTETHAQDYTNAPGQLGSVMKYVVRGDWVELLPLPAQAYQLRMTYYLRPSTLVLPTSDGLISAVNAITNQMTVNARPTSIDAAPLPAVDIVHPAGWYSVVTPTLGQPSNPGVGLVNLAPEDGVSTIDYSRIALGSDYVRAASTSEWPALPEEFHSTLAKLTAVNIMTQLNMLEKKSVTEQNAAYEFQRFVDMLKPRVKAEAEVLKAPRSVLQVGRSQRGFFGWR